MKKNVFGKVKDFFHLLKKNRVLYTFLAVIVAFNMLVISSYAWLTLNRKTDVDEMGMALAVDDTNAVYLAYMYDLKTHKGTDKNADGEQLNIANIDLNQYDTIFKGQNKYTPVFAKIVLTRNKSMPLNGSVYLTMERDGEADQGLSLTDYSSSIIRCTAFILPDHTDNGMDPDALYSYISSPQRFKEVELYSGNDRDYSKTFVTVEGEGEGHTHAKTTSITLKVDYQESNWYKNDLGHQMLNVYLYITYDVQLVECYMDENAGGSLSLDDNSVDFKNDLKKITASYR